MTIPCNKNLTKLLNSYNKNSSYITVSITVYKTYPKFLKNKGNKKIFFILFFMSIFFNSLKNANMTYFKCQINFSLLFYSHIRIIE